MGLQSPSDELEKAMEQFWRDRKAGYLPDPASFLDLSRNDLSGLNLFVSLEDCNLAYARCQGTTFGRYILRCHAHHADFSDAFLKKAQIDECNLDDAIFRGAKLLKASADKSTFRRADFAGADLTMASFFRCDLRDARFAGTALPQVGFNRSLLAGADFTGCTGWIDPVHVNIGTPEEPHWIEGDELLEWLRAAGGAELRVGVGPVPAPDEG